MVPGAPETPRTLKDITQMAAKQYLAGLITECNGNITHVARVAGIHRFHVYRLANQYGLDYQGKRK